METAVFGKPLLRTYSRECKTRQMNDVLFTEKAFKSNRSYSPFACETIDDNLGSTSVTKSRAAPRKRKNSDEVTSCGTLKKTKQSRSKKSQLQRRKPSRQKKNLPHAQDLYKSLLCDTLFGDDMTASRKIKHKPSETKQRKKETRKGVEDPGAKDSTGVNRDPLQDMKMAVHDKVTAWFARSVSCSPSLSDEERSIEQLRGEEQISGHERRNKLFPDEFFNNLHTIVTPGYKHKVPLDKDKIKEKQNSFFAQLRLRGSGFTTTSARRSIPNLSPVLQTTAGYTSDFEIGTNTDTCTADTMTSTFVTQQASKTGKTATSCATDHQTDTSHYTTDVPTGTSHYTTDVPTGTSHYTTDVQTGTSHYTTDVPTETSHYTTDVPTGISHYTTDVPNGNSHYTTEVPAETSHYTTDVPTGTSHYTSRKGTRQHATISSKSRDEQKEDFFSGRLSDNVEPVTMKYLSSTLKKGVMTDQLEFSTEISAITQTDSVKKKRQQEQTPKRMPVFKIPGSPSKSQGNKGQRKGSLEPKNSTKLFTTGFVEIVDAIPELSSIRFDLDSDSIKRANVEEITSPITSPTITAIADGSNPQVHVPIKTSTPNKLAQNGELEFEIDISSVNVDSDDDGCLVFNQSSREVNSEEILHLSTTVIDLREDQITTKSQEDKSTDGMRITKKPVKNTMSPAPIKNINMQFVNPPEGQKSDEKNSGNKNKTKTSTVINKKSNIDKVHDKRQGEVYDADESVVGTVGKNQRKSKLIHKTARGKLKNYRDAAKRKTTSKIPKLKQSTCISNISEKSTFSNDPKKLLLFSKTKETNAERSLSKLFHTTKEGSMFQKSNIDKSAVVKETKTVAISKHKQDRNKSAVNTSIKEAGHEDSALTSKVCSLMNEHFVCPRLEVCLMKFVTKDSRSYKEVINSVPFDDLM